MKRFTALALSLLAVLFWTSGAWAQGTTTSPNSVHVPYSDGNLYVGGILDQINGPGPYPIDLDVNGGPWTKQMKSSPNSFFQGFDGDLIETIINVGNEPWYDWHETLFSGAIGAGWAGLATVRINGSPITYTQTISGPTLTIDNFSQPVMPGDVLMLHKLLITTNNVVGPNQVLFTVLEYPTPEPASAALVGLGAGACLLRKRP